MAVPWQTDTSSCLSRYVAEEGDYLPTFWPARVPNDVLAPEGYASVLDPSLDLARRQRAFATRPKWLRGLPSIKTSPIPRINAFIAVWDRAGIVTRQRGPDDGAPFPDEIWVELGHAIDPGDPPSRGCSSMAPPASSGRMAIPRAQPRSPTPMRRRTGRTSRLPKREGEGAR
jgi:hypothetical protein